MPLWKITPEAAPGDPRWQDHRIWKEIIVRAPTAALARLQAAQLEEHRNTTHLESSLDAEETDQQGEAVGNESSSNPSALFDEKLYHLREITSETAQAEAEGEDEVIRAELLDPHA